MTRDQKQGTSPFNISKEQFIERIKVATPDIVKEKKEFLIKFTEKIRLHRYEAENVLNRYTKLSLAFITVIAFTTSLFTIFNENNIDPLDSFIALSPFFIVILLFSIQLLSFSTITSNVINGSEEETDAALIAYIDAEFEYYSWTKIREQIDEKWPKLHIVKASTLVYIGLLSLHAVLSKFITLSIYDFLILDLIGGVIIFLLWEKFQSNKQPVSFQIQNLYRNYKLNFGI